MLQNIELEVFITTIIIMIKKIVKKQTTKCHNKNLKS